MIQAKELRIGNWLDVTTTVGSSQFEQVYSGAYIDVLINNPEFANPIFLTTEILEKCELNISGEIGDQLGDMIHEEGRTLHWLQNIYFAITGQEMEINL